ncbi:MAG: hypothetical protein ACPGNP_01345, partial [Acidimicrobiales bacterium]
HTGRTAGKPTGKAASVKRHLSQLISSGQSQRWGSRDKWYCACHLQIIFFGREYCPARNHDLATCDICSWAATKKQIALEAKAAPKKPSATKTSTSRG